MTQEVKEASGNEKERRFHHKPRNLIAKIFSLLAAFALWFYVMSSQSPDYKGNFNGVEVDLYGIASIEQNFGLSAIFGNDADIDVVLKGKKNDIDNMSTDGIYAYVDVSSVNSAGTYELPVRISTPSGTKVESYHPQTLSIYFDSQSTRQIPVKTTKTVNLETGYSLGTITTNVEYVSVTGPSAFMETVSSAVLEMDLGNIKNSMTCTGDLVLADKDGMKISNAFTKISPATATATVPLYITKSINIEASCINGYFTSDNSQVTVSPSKIEVMMPVEMDDTLSAITAISIDETQISGDVTLSSAIKLPEGVTNLSGITEAKVTIKLKNTVTKTFKLSKSDIEILNVPEGYQVEIVTDSVSFGARGAKGSFENIDISNFKASIDLTGHAIEGTSSVVLSVGTEDTGVYILNSDRYPMPTVMISMKKVV